MVVQVTMNKVRNLSAIIVVNLDISLENVVPNTVATIKVPATNSRIAVRKIKVGRIGIEIIHRIHIKSTVTHLDTRIRKLLQ